MDTLPEKYLLQYIVKKTKKKQFTSQDINEIKQSTEKMIGVMCECGDESKAFEVINDTLEHIKYSSKKIGVMISFVHPEHPTMMASGWSLCNLSADDKFDCILIDRDNIKGIGLYEPAEGIGKHIAVGRAIEWAEVDKMYSIPDSIKQQFKDFVLRSQRYYKDKVLPIWVSNFLDA